MFRLPSRFIECRFMNYGWEPTLHPSSFAPFRSEPYTAEGWFSLDRGTWLLSALPPLLNQSLTMAYGGSWQELADELNSDLASIKNKRTIYEILMWYSKVAEANEKVCWQTHYATALERYKTVLGALNSLFVDPKTIGNGESYVRRPMDLPPLYLDTSVLHCVHPDAAIYDQMKEIVNSVSLDWPAKTLLADFRDMADKAAHPFGRALFHAARERYDCPYYDGCSTKALYNGFPYLAPSFIVFIGTMQKIFWQRRHVCLAFDEVPAIPETSYTFVSSQYHRRGPKMVAATCRHTACYFEFNEAAAAKGEFCSLHHMEYRLPVYVHANVFSKPTRCGKPKLMLDPEQFRPVCACLKNSLRPSLCFNMACYYDVLTTSNYDVERLKRDCQSGRLSHDMIISVPLTLFSRKPSCGVNMIEFAVEERREVCKCVNAVRQRERKARIKSLSALSMRLGLQGSYRVA
ncbi:hypothetical protein XA68_12005 [Ophiocordyceps unilateralis]|uniref:Uncharacterized protein n=1 Tax=Ophiocordyceps unilateralis TaxID=268505 RepID=A0A2A9PPH4_OPHUN|nr:hypothetical protein XA68_12005 [Ophiocordyceps unilateralis]